ncbi:hypothetical protein P171DRAFT_443092 [Karstenula rhodostoma CBS 690.94]|uniref:Uncharacterized protein n=1 Tax=Karstenula rhodostoma CBS 690.94 TaxID=1392251 RepID=A0A9P4PJZ0_9PLEO|nr:hypothetical protein P171DRAFT_443092 [Karstenula rhodostoma CBS 690.94]
MQMYQWGTPTRSPGRTPRRAERVRIASTLWIVALAGRLSRVSLPYSGQQFTTSSVELSMVTEESQALVHPTGQMPGEYTIEVSESGKAGGKQLGVKAPGATNHCVLS